MSLKHAPKEVRIEKISGEGGSPGAACVALCYSNFFEYKLLGAYNTLKTAQLSLEA